MPLSPLSDTFWAVEEEILGHIIFPWAAGVAEDAAKSSAEMLIDAGVAIDWDLVNARAAEWARYYGSTLITKTTAAIRMEVSGQVEAWVRSGNRLEDLQAKLASSFGETRAKWIAATETTRAFSEANVSTWKSHGVKAKRWVTGNDELVCELCGPLDGQIIEIGGEWEGVFSGESVGVQGPPLHVSCRCFLQPAFLDPVPKEEIAEAVTGEYSLPEFCDPLKEWDEASRLGTYRFKDTQIGANPNLEPAAQAKNQIVETLSQKTGIPYERTNAFIEQWARSSNDASYSALKAQQIAAEMFDAPLSEWQAEKLAKVLEDRAKMIRSGFSTNRRLCSVFEKAGGQLADDVIAAGFTNEDDVFRAILRAMYENTQEHLAAQGITEIQLYRGASVSQSTLDKLAESTTGMVPVTGNAMESWSLSASTADLFAYRYADSPGVVFRAIIPRERIIGTFRTGYGCMDETEFVVIGSPIPNLVQVWSTSIARR